MYRAHNNLMVRIMHIFVYDGYTLTTIRLWSSEVFEAHMIKEAQLNKLRPFVRRQTNGRRFEWSVYSHCREGVGFRGGRRRHNSAGEFARARNIQSAVTLLENSHSLSHIRSGFSSLSLSRGPATSYIELRIALPGNAILGYRAHTRGRAIGTANGE